MPPSEHNSVRDAIEALIDALEKSGGWLKDGADGTEMKNKTPQEPGPNKPGPAAITREFRGA